MEIEQFLYDLNDSGDAVVGYTMTSANGGAVQLCNLGASVLSYEVAGVADGGNILEGCCVRGSKGLYGADVVGGVKFDELLWEGRVETNRVVMSLQFEDGGVGFMAETIFDFDDDNMLEITYILSPDLDADCDVEVDMSHRFVSGVKVVDMCDLVAEDAIIYRSSSAKQNILSRVMVLDGVEVLSSQPQMALLEGGFCPLTTPQRVVQGGERYIQKSVFQIVK